MVKGQSEGNSLQNLLEYFQPANVLITSEGEILHMSGETAPFLKPEKERTGNLKIDVLSALQEAFQNALKQAVDQQAETNIYIALPPPNSLIPSPLELTVSPIKTAENPPLVMVQFQPQLDTVSQWLKEQPNTESSVAQLTPELYQQALFYKTQALERTEAISHTGSWEWFVEENVVVWSKETYRIFGIESMDKTPNFEQTAKHLTPESYQNLENCVKKALEKGIPYELEVSVVRADNSTRHCLTRGYPHWDKTGKVKHLYGSIQDITERKQIEWELQESKKTLENIAHSIPGLVLRYKLNPDGTDELVFLSKGVEDVFKVEQQKAKQNIRLLWDRIHPDDELWFQASIAKSAAELSYWEVEHRILLPDGRVKWVHSRGVPKKMGDGSTVWDTLQLDITGKKEIEEHLESLQEQLQLAIKTVQLGVWTLDLKTQKLEWNDRQLEIYGITREAFEQDLDGWRKLVYPEDLEHADKELEKAFKGESVFGVNFRIKRLDGEIRHISASASPLFKDGGIVKIIGANLDISEYKQIQDRLMQAKEEAENKEEIVAQQNLELIKANQELDRFVYSVSHDLRAPIASSMGLTHLSLQSNDVDEIHEYDQLQLKTLKKLDVFIKDILNYSRNSRVLLDIEPIDFKKLIDTILSEYATGASQKGIKIIQDVQAKSVYRGDRLRIDIIVNNLISNAFKFIDEQKENNFVKVAIKIDPEQALIKVSDSGIGIKKERQPRIFEMFYRGTTFRGGSGIGLYILKECLDKLKGTISCESEEGKGASFTLQIPNAQGL